MKSSPKFYVSNAFSPSMLGGINYEVMFEFFQPEEEADWGHPGMSFIHWLYRVTDGDIPPELLGIKVRKPTMVSCVGHKDTAQVFSSVLGTHVPVNRISVTLNAGDFMLIGTPKDLDGKQVRLPEGATTLPDGVQIGWCLAHIPVEYPALTECPHCWEAL
jgi:hypothetical protein